MKKTKNEHVRNYGPLSLNRYKFSNVKKFTNSFKVKLGQGDYVVSTKESYSMVFL